MENDPRRIGIKDRCPRCGNHADRTDRLLSLEVSRRIQRNGNSSYCDNCNNTY